MRRGFTLLELIVTVVILAVLAAVLIPASENVRRASTRASCQNNLKQLGMAAHTYRDTHGHFPPGTVGGTQLPPEQRLSFYALLLPYTEGKTPFNKLDQAAPWDAPANAKAMDNWPGNLYRCIEWMGRYGYSSRAGFATDHLSTTNYVGVAGVGADAATRPDDAPGIGFFGYDRKLKTEQVKDGLSSTMVLIETGHEVGPWLRGGTSTVRAINPDAGPLTGDGAPFGGTHFRDKAFFRGTVTEGFFILLGDGTARYVKGELAPDLLAALATVAGNEEIPAGW
jgi:prepilin-type N-terminal cleavage/methylation domain-containing protein